MSASTTPELTAALQAVVRLLYPENRRDLDQAVRAVYAAAKAAGVSHADAQMQLAKHVGQAIFAHIKTLQLKNSWRPNPYELAVVAFSPSGRLWYGYNDKPFEHKPQDYRYWRVCGEQACVRQADNAGEPLELSHVFLIGQEHHNGHKQLPSCCRSCLRLFTTLPNHRNIVITSINDAQTKTWLMAELIADHPPAQVHCSCCKKRKFSFVYRLRFAIERFLFKHIPIE